MFLTFCFIVRADSACEAKILNLILQKHDINFTIKSFAYKWLIKKFSISSVIIRKSNGQTGHADPQPLDFRSIVLPIEQI